MQHEPGEGEGNTCENIYGLGVLTRGGANYSSGNLREGQCDNFRA